MSSDLIPDHLDRIVLLDTKRVDGVLVVDPRSVEVEADVCALEPILAAVTVEDLRDHCCPFDLEGHCVLVLVGKLDGDLLISLFFVVVVHHPFCE